MSDWFWVIRLVSLLTVRCSAYSRSCLIPTVSSANLTIRTFLHPLVHTVHSKCTIHTFLCIIQRERKAFSQLKLFQHVFVLQLHVISHWNTGSKWQRASKVKYARLSADSNNLAQSKATQIFEFLLSQALIHFGGVFWIGFFMLICSTS